MVVKITTAALVAVALFGGAHAQQNATNQLTARSTFGASSIGFPVGPPTTAAVSNAAATQFVMDVKANPFLATLPSPGISFNWGQLNACTVLLPHVHPRATEAYFLVSGNVSCGLSEEAGGRNFISVPLNAQSVFIAPQGLPHFINNPTCSPAVFTQSFNNLDPGTVVLNNALAAYPADVLSAAGVTAQPTSGAFVQNQACLARCGGSSGAAAAPSGAPASGASASASAMTTTTSSG